MRRTVWFVGGCRGRRAGAGYAKRKVAAAASKLRPANVADAAPSAPCGAVGQSGRRRRPGGRADGAGARARAARRARRPAGPPRRPPRPRRRGARRRRAGRVRPGSSSCAGPTRPSPTLTATATTPAGEIASTTLDRGAAPRAGADRVRDGATELSLYRHDASTHGGRRRRGVLPAVDRRRSQACVRDRRAPRRAVRRPRVGHRSGRWRRAARGRGGHLDDQDEPGPVGRPAGRRAWVEPGVLNLDLSRAVARHGLHFAPDPSSQQTLLDRRQRRQQLRRAALPRRGGHQRPHPGPRGGAARRHRGRARRRGPRAARATTCAARSSAARGCSASPPRCCVRLTPDPPAVCTMLIDFDVRRGRGVDGERRSSPPGIVPAALEMMDQLCLQAVEAYIHAGLPVDAAAALLVEVVGLPHGVAADVELIARIAARARRAHRAHRRRRGRAGAAVEGPQVGVRRDRPDQAELLPPRHRRAPARAARPCWPRCTRSRARHDLLVLNVFHAGDGNLHPLLVFDGREPGHDGAGRTPPATRSCGSSVEAGGVLSGEHGIGLEKRDLMPLMFSAGRPRRPGRAAGGVRPARPGQPGQGAAQPGRRAATCQVGPRASPRARGSDGRSPRRSAPTDPVTITGLGHTRRTGARRPRRRRAGRRSTGSRPTR